jgi:hypothetical protein
MREELKSDVTSSLAYASGWDKIEKRNFKTRERGMHEEKPQRHRNSIPRLRFGLG